MKVFSSIFIIIFVIVILTVAAGGFYFIHSKNPPSSANISSKQQVKEEKVPSKPEVSIFAPKLLHITKTYKSSIMDTFLKVSFSLPLDMKENVATDTRVDYKNEKVLIRTGLQLSPFGYLEVGGTITDPGAKMPIHHTKFYDSLNSDKKVGYNYLMYYSNVRSEDKTVCVSEGTDPSLKFPPCMRLVFIFPQSQAGPLSYTNVNFLFECDTATNTVDMLNACNSIAKSLSFEQ